jgi:CRISPR-associated protein Csb2
MIVLELRFPAGRYHATPWERHVNEGAVEWPPSPWRILRALIATWYWKARRNGEISEVNVRALVNALSRPPVFRLPRATTAHTRHYMPYNEGKNEKTTKVFDTFIQLADDDAVLVAWDADLSPELLATLKTLVARLGYFGRAESLVEARILEGITAIKPNALPLLNKDAKLPEKTELVRLLAPLKPSDYEKWHADFLVANPPAEDSKKKSGKKSKAVETLKVPEDLFAALHADTGELQAAGWNLPPGAQSVYYIRPENAFAPAAKPRPRRAGRLPTVARYAIASVVPPAITGALAVGEQIHTVLCKESDGHPVFTGADGKDHQHAHVFCESVGDSNAHITHVTVFAPEGFDPKAVESLRKLQWTWGFKGHELRTVLHGIGQPEEFKGCALFGSSKVWRSLTPFVSTRHAKTFRDGRPKMDVNGWQEGSAAHDLLRLLATNPKWTGAKIRRQIEERDLPFEFGNRRLRSLQFLTIRRGGNGSRGHDGGAAFIIEFPKPVSGPIAVGYGAHFGLGLFVPVVDS